MKGLNKATFEKDYTAHRGLFCPNEVYFELNALWTAQLKLAARNDLIISYFFLNFKRISRPRLLLSQISRLHLSSVFTCPHQNSSSVFSSLPLCTLRLKMAALINTFAAIKLSNARNTQFQTRPFLSPLPTISITSEFLDSSHQCVLGFTTTLQ